MTDGHPAGAMLPPIGKRVVFVAFGAAVGLSKGAVMDSEVRGDVAAVGWMEILTKLLNEDVESAVAGLSFSDRVRKLVAKAGPVGIE